MHKINTVTFQLVFGSAFRARECNTVVYTVETYICEQHDGRKRDLGKLHEHADTDGMVGVSVLGILAQMHQNRAQSCESRCFSVNDDRQGVRTKTTVYK